MSPLIEENLFTSPTNSQVFQQYKRNRTTSLHEHVHVRHWARTGPKLKGNIQQILADLKPNTIIMSLHTEGLQNAPKGMVTELGVARLDLSGVLHSLQEIVGSHGTDSFTLFTFVTTHMSQDAI